MAIQYNNSDDISNSSKIIKIDKRCKVKNEHAQINWDFKKSNYGQIYQYGWKNGSSNNLSLNYPIPGCNFGSFSKIYDSYNDNLKQGILANIGIHDAIMTPTWDWPEWFMF